MSKNFFPPQANSKAENPACASCQAQRGGERRIELSDLVDLLLFDWNWIVHEIKEFGELGCVIEHPDRFEFGTI